jgi:hypothetical protein
MSTSSRGELELSAPLYTGDGIELAKGKFRIEIRSEKGRRFLAFQRGGDVIALVNGQPSYSGEKVEKHPDLPMIGTVYLYPPEIPREPEKEEKSTVTFAEHLRTRPWKAALRAYRFSDPQSSEVDFILREESKPGEWSRTDFKLFLKKPS